MDKSRAVSGCVALVLIMASLVPLIGCRGAGTNATPTPAPTITAIPSTIVTPTPSATPTVTANPTSTPTSTSGKRLADLYGVGKNIGDVQFVMVMTSAGAVQPMTQAYWKDAWVPDKMKFRYEISTEGSTSIYLVDFGTQIAYMWLKEQNIAYEIDLSQAPRNPAEGSDQIYPAYLGTETMDGKLCDVYQYTTSDAATKVWIWKDKSFPIRMESTTSSGTTIQEYRNIVFGPLSNDLFRLPASVQIMQLPVSTPQP